MSPPNPGVFSVQNTYAPPLRPSRPKAEQTSSQDQFRGPVASSSTSNDELRKDKKRRDIASRMSRDMSDRREEYHQYSESVSSLQSLSMQLFSRPSTYAIHNARLYPISLERSALLVQAANQEEYGMDIAKTAWDVERAFVEDKWKEQRETVRERLLEGIEERRKRAREEKDSEGVAGDVNLDPQVRPHITRKLRNKMGSGMSPPPTHHPSARADSPQPRVDPHSLSIDELPSPFPLPLTSLSALNGFTSGNGRRKAKGGNNPNSGGHVFGKSLGLLITRDQEIEEDLSAIRKSSKRKRQAAMSLTRG